MLASWSHSGTQNSLRGAVEFPAAGTYTLVVDPTLLNTGSVDLTVWDGIHDAGAITPTSEGASKTLPLKVPGGLGKATFEASAGQDVLLNFSEISFEAFIGVHKPGGGAISGSESALPKGGSKVLELSNLPSTGKYTIWLIAKSATSGETGSVKVTAYAPPEDITGALAPSEAGAQKSPSISSPGQNARYSVEAEAGEAVTLSTSASTFNGQYHLEWFNPSGALINKTSWSGTASGFWNYRQEFSTPGTYTLVLNPEGMTTGSATVTAWDATTYDAGAITPSAEGASKTLPLKVPGGMTKATFEATAGQDVLLNFSEITFKAFIGVHKPGGGAFSGSESALPKGGSKALELSNLPSTGTYTIWLVAQTAGVGETGSVKVTAYAPPEDITGALAPSEAGAQKSPSISSPGQNARYSVEAEAGEAVTLSTSASTFNGEYHLEWLNPSGGLLKKTSWSGAAGGFWGYRQEFSSPGTYTIRINPEGTTTGSVTVTAWDATVYDAGAITPSAEGASKTLPLKVPGGMTKATFAGTTGQKVRFDFSEITFSAYVGIHKPSGGAFTGSESALPKGSTKAMEMTLPSTGTYTIWLVPQGSNNAEFGSVKATAYLKSTVGRFAPLQSSSVLVASTGIDGADVYFDGAAPDPDGSEPHDRQPPRAEPSRPTRKVDSWLEARADVTRTTNGSITPAMWRFQPDAADAWHPPRMRPGVNGWEAGEPRSPWEAAPALRAAPGVTAMAGQALDIDGRPLAGVRVSIEGSQVLTETDAAGRFLLSAFPTGKQVLILDGESVPGNRRYGVYEAGVDVVDGETTTLEYTSWLTPLDRTGDQKIASPTEQPTSLRTPRIPGLEVRIPAGTVIRDADGDAIRKLNISAIPVDRPPFPLPPFVSVPLYFTVQPGQAYLSKGAQIVYPNWTDLPPGQRVDFWNYDPHDRGWYVYGQGSVTEDGTQVMPDPHVRVWEFTGAMITSSPTPPEEWATGAYGGDPVDLYSGLFSYHKTDLTLPDAIPISIERTYRPADANSYAFGIGTTSFYDMRLWSTNNYKEADLIQPDGGRIHYVRVSPGESWTDAVYESSNKPGAFFGSRISWDASVPGWNLELRNGLTFVFGENAPLQAIRDRYGNRLTIRRASGQTGNITQITAPHGRWAKFSYDGSNRITEIADNGGRKLKYTYTSGRLTKIEAPGSRTTEYEYDEAGRMKAVINARGNKYLQNEYDANGRVKKQTMGDGGIFEFAYELDEAGKAKSTSVTDPRGYQRRVTFNSEGFPASETAALGNEAARTTSWIRQAKTGLILSQADPLGRKTVFEYDSSGNVTEVTRLAGTEDEVTTKFAYEPGTSNITEVSDPLGHATLLEYGPDGELLKQIDPLENETTLEYNEDGQPVSILNPEEEEIKLAYDHGDLASVTDPLGRTIAQHTDALGRVRSITSPSGSRTLFTYNDADELTTITSPSSSTTTIGYDKDGDVVSITDPRENETAATYDAMDRLSSGTNPLEDTGQWSYDKAGNLIEAVSRSGEVSEFEYDALGRLAKVSFGVEGESVESTIQYEYDDGDRLIGVDDSASGEYVLDYDELDRLTELSGPEGTVGYSYDDAGRRTAMTVPGEEPLLYGYDDANRMTGLARGLQAVSLVYDDADRLTGLTLPDGIEQIYAYDNAGQATSITYKDGETTLGDLQYAYDADGRTNAIWGSYARMDLPEELESTKYNAANQLIEREGEALFYDANGNLVDDGASEYEWDARGQLAGIEGPINASFAHDPFGRRISKTIGEATTGFLHDGGNVVQEYSGEELTGSVLTGLGLDQIFSRSTSEGTDSRMTDRLGSTVALANGSGEVATTYSYEPFGTASSAGGPSDNPFQFTGRENDGTRLQYNRARYYDPATARFISPDPAGFAGSGPNLYNYVGGNPLDFTDPSGKVPSWPHNPFGDFEDAVSGVVTGAANNLATSGGFVWDHKAEFGAAGAAGVCVVSLGVGCGVASAGSLFLATLENAENDHCGSFLRDEAFSLGATALGGLPGLLPRAAGAMAPGLLPATAGGRAAFNAPYVGTGYGGASVVEPGLQERYGGGSSATSSC